MSTVEADIRATLIDIVAKRPRREPPVTAARLGEEMMSECLHVFGGIGYLTGPTPMERWRRDMKLSRVVGGADEVLWEVVAAGMGPNFDAHDQRVRP